MGNLRTRLVMDAIDAPVTTPADTGLYGFLAERYGCNKDYARQVVNELENAAVVYVERIGREPVGYDIHPALLRRSKAPWTPIELREQRGREGVAYRGWWRVGLAVAALTLGGVGCSGSDVDGGRSKGGSSTPASTTSTAAPSGGPVSWAYAEDEWFAAPSLPFGEPREEWSVETGETFDGARVVDDRLVYATRTGVGSFDVVALALNDGEEVWRRSFQGSIAPVTRQDPPMEGGLGAEPVIVPNDSYLVIRGEDRMLRLDPDDGSVVWNLDLDDGETLTVDDRGPTACAGSSQTDASGETVFHCTSLREGKEVWSAPGYLLFQSDEVAYLRSDAGITAFDGRTGEERWSALGAGSDLVEVDDTAVICDPTAVYGIDRSGLRQWDRAVESPECIPGPDGTVVVTSGRRLLRLHSSDGRQLGKELRLADTASSAAMLAGRYLVRPGYDELGEVIDIRSGAATPLPAGPVGAAAGDGMVQVANTVDFDEEGPGAWRVVATRVDGRSWSADVGWTHPDVIPTDRGLLVLDLGFGGQIWFGSQAGTGPTLSKAAAPYARDQRAPTGRTLTGTTVLGVPFGTPFDDARDRLIEVLGRPSTWNEHAEPGDWPDERLMWGTLQVEFAVRDGVPELSGWSDWAVSQGSGWTIAGNLTTWSTRADIQSAGYAAEDDTFDLCRDGVCFVYWYEGESTARANKVRAPSSDAAAG